MNRSTSTFPLGDEALQATYAVLNRNSSFSALPQLAASLEQTQKSTPTENFESLENIAIGLDTNALFRIGMHQQNSSDTLDYLTGPHSAPLVLPGQAIQEVWNNSMTGVKTKSKKLEESYKALVKQVEDLDRNLGPHAEEAAESLASFAKWHGDWFDGAAHQGFTRALQQLSGRAISMSVPRVEFSELAEIRNNTKTPPGFSDPSDSHGDFFIWADFLYALAKSDLSKVEGVIFVTEDSKQDWRRANVGHPILTAEIELLTGLPFKLYTLKDLFSLVKKKVGRSS